MSGVIITAALTGAVTSRMDTPYVPLTKHEIAREAAACEAAGAAVVHLHLRDAEGSPRLGEEPFLELVEEVRVSTKALICLSTSSWGTNAGVDERIAGLTAKPDLASFHVGSMNRGEALFLNSPEYQRALIEITKRNGVKPEFELFDLGQLARAVEIHRESGYAEPFYAQFVLGVKGGCPAEPRHLLHMVESLPPGAVWSVAAVGRMQLPMNLLGLILGGNIRTGLEDNVFLRRNVLAPGNAALVERIAGVARELGREPASPEDARGILGLGKKPSAKGEG